MSSNLKEKTAGALFWSTLNNGTMQVLNLLFGICLSRLLDVADYGMVGMLTIFSVIATSLQESGFFIALGNKKEITHRDYNAVFWFNIGMSAFLYLSLFLASPFIADFYGNEDLVPLARYTFIGFFIGSFGIVHSAYLYRNLMTRQRAIATLSALLISGCVGVGMAYWGFSYWGIATQSILYIAITTILYTYFSKWRPTWEFSFQPIREMIGTSSKLLITNLCNHLNQHLLSVFLGRFYDAYQVGLFNQANKWNTMGHSTLTGIIQGVAIPTFREVEPTDTERLRRVLRKMVRFTVFISFPAMGSLALVAPELIHITITDKWIESAYLLRYLAIGGAVFPLIQLYTHFIISRGRTEVYMWATLAQAMVQIACVYFLSSQGTFTMLCAYIGINVVWGGVWQYFIWKEVGWSVWLLLRQVFPFGLSALVSIGISYFVGSLIEEVYARFFVQCAVVGAFYFAILWVCQVEECREILHFVKRKQSKNE